MAEPEKVVTGRKAGETTGVSIVVARNRADPLRVLEVLAASRVFALLILLFCGLCNSAFADPESGWWWNPSESGRGFFVESHGGVTFIGAYLYDDDGHATWVVSGGPNPDPYNWTGPLYYKTNGQTLFGTYVAPGDATVVGQLSVHFGDDTHATVTWPGGQVAIERQIFGAGAPAFAPYTGWWWNPNESGSGYSVEVQGNNLFIVGFMYDDSARPVWYFSAGPITGPTTYHGDVLQFADGQTIGGPYQHPGTPVKVATLDMQFTDTTHATLTFNGVSAPIRRASEKAGQTRSDNLTTQLGTKPSTYTLPTSFTGSLSFEAKQHTVGGSGGTFDTDFIVNFTNLRFVFDPGNPGRYNLAGSYSYSSSFYGVEAVPGGTCIHQQPQVTLSQIETAFVLMVDNYVLTAESAESPGVTLYIPDRLSFDGSETCTLVGQTLPTETVTEGPGYADLYEGKVTSGVVQGEGTRHDSPPDGPVTTTYHLTLTPGPI